MSRLLSRCALLSLASCLVLGLALAAEDDSHLRGSSPLDAELGKVVTIPGAADPHGSADLCGECHEQSAAGQVAPGLPPMASCERCHPDTNFHLVGVAPEEVGIPEDMPLQGGMVTCLTCHDEPACDGLDKQARGEHHFRNGPFSSVIDSCFACHDRETFQQTDPHRDLRKADGERNDAVCVFCHQGVPESAEDEKVETLRVDPIELCKGCHAHQIHVGIPSHLKLLSDEMAAVVQRYNGQTEYPIPIGPRGEVFCSSCHDPHPGLDPLPTDTSPTVLDGLRESNRAYRNDYYLPRLRDELSAITDVDGQTLVLQDGEREKDGLLRVPADDGSLCLICHDLEAEGR